MNAKNKVNLNLIPDGERSGLFLFHKLTQSYLGKSFGLGPELGWELNGDYNEVPTFRDILNFCIL